MNTRDAFEEWAERGRDVGMAERHWHTVAPILSSMPVESGDAVLDLGCGSGYALRALRAAGARRGVGVDAAPGMARNARSYTDDDAVSYLVADFERLPLADASVDHAFSMEAVYYAADPRAALREVARVLRSGGTFYCAVDFYEENRYSHGWRERIDVPMTLWSARDYREAFRGAGFSVAGQANVPDRETEIPAAEAFPHEGFDTRAEMVERYRDLGTLLTVGVAP